MGKSKKNSIELYFEWFLNELIEEGYVEKYDREAEKLSLFPIYNHKRLKTFKTKDPIEEPFMFMRDLSYHYDYRIFWTEKGNNLFYQEFVEDEPFYYGKPVFVSQKANFTDKDGNTESKMISLVDVKPPPAIARFGNVSTIHTFPIVQKILFNLWKIYVNKTVPIPTKGSGHSSALFCVCFTPKRYLFTDGGKQGRKINFKFQTLEEFIEIRKKEIKRVENEINGGERQQNLF